MQHSYLREGERDPNLLVVPPKWFLLGRGVDVRVLTKAATAVINHHEALRTRISERKGHLRQIAVPRLNIDTVARLYDVAMLSPDEQRAAMAMITRELFRNGLPIRTAPMCRLLLIDRGASPGFACFVANHLVFDAHSERVVMEDLRTACHALRSRSPIKLPPSGEGPIEWADRVRVFGSEPRLRADLRAIDAAEGLPWSECRLECCGGDGAGQGSTSVHVGAEATSLALARLQSMRVTTAEFVIVAVAYCLSRQLRHPGAFLRVHHNGRSRLPIHASLARSVGLFTIPADIGLRPDFRHDFNFQFERLVAQFRRQRDSAFARAAARVHQGYGAEIPIPDVTVNFLGGVDASEQQLPGDAPLRPLHPAPWLGSEAEAGLPPAALYVTAGLQSGGVLHIRLAHHLQRLPARDAAGLAEGLREVVTRLAN